ncbi:YqcI/YcgG family protein [Heyndrickxia sp. NPDC080065]|uniref:YqcI/YcgG family protein n=1 Tax=Heyndrickxia sp. NPDC080065 TaxID=3390568 RepID=UPI003D00AF1D
MDKLFDKNVLEEPLSSWQRDAMEAFDKKIMNKEFKFPCIPAFQGYVLNHMRFGFIKDPRIPDTALELAALLKTYGSISRETGDYSALVIFFETPSDLKDSFSIQEYEQLFWNLLNQLALLDEAEWPDQISSTPAHHTWEFCFNNERYFFYCATPAHVQRKSRYFPYFMLAITPRWVLEKYSSISERAEKMKERIRERLSEYDLVPPHPDLKWYGQSDNHEWKQYFLRDDDSTIASCPFKHHMKNKNDS